ncbi:methylenetetrahydrofolate reductase (NAD(P)H) met13 [Savitreella phatthalungensis]
MRITEKLALAGSEQPTWSYEYFPPKTDDGMANLRERIQRMASWGPPAFVDITWGAGGSRPALTVELVDVAQNIFKLDTCMHLICTGMPAAQVKQALTKARSLGCQTILALRGDPPSEQEKWEATQGGFAYARDLVQYIRAEHGDYFDVGVAGYSDGHPECTDEELSIHHLKAKVDAGADFIVTQMFYDAGKFLGWVNKCRASGIEVPIIPGIMPISAWESFERRVKWSEASVPESFYRILRPLKDDEARFKMAGAKLVAEMCRTLIAGGISHLHFYTMNLEKATRQVMEELKLV